MLHIRLKMPLVTYAGKGLCTVLLSMFDCGIEVTRDVTCHRDPLEKLPELRLCRLAEAASEVIGHDNHKALKEMLIN